MNAVFRCHAAFLLLSAAAAAVAAADVTSDKIPRSKLAEREKATVQLPPAAEPRALPARPEKDFLKSRSEGVQITELGLMRAAFVFEKGFAAGLEDQVTETFSNVGFRVFPTGIEVEGRISPADAFKMGNDRYSDLVVFVKGGQRPLKSLGRMEIYESTVSVKVYNPLSEELLVSTTATVKGQPNVDSVIARRSATQAACDAAVRETITKTLEQSARVIVHEAQLKGVQNHEHLLEIMEYTARLKGVYHVRQCAYDTKTGLAVIEIIGSPQTEVFWRAYVEKLPRREVLIKKNGSVEIRQSRETRAAHGDWFPR